MASKRASMRASNSSRSGARKTLATRARSIVAGLLSSCQSCSERPVASTTSSARVTRARSPGIKRAAPDGSRAASSAWRAGAPSLCQPRAHVFADSGGDRRHGGKAPRQRAEIKPGAADDDRKPSRFPCRGERRRGVGAPAAHRVVLRSIDMAVQPMRHAPFLVGRRPRGHDAQIAIDLHGIGIDDLAAELLGKRERQGRLAARRRACNEDGRRHVWIAPFPTARIARHVLCSNADLAPQPPGGDRRHGAEGGALSAAWPSGRLARCRAWRPTLRFLPTNSSIPARRSRKPAQGACSGHPRHHRRRAGRRRHPAPRRPPQETFPCRHGLHHDRPGMYRRTCRLCRFQRPRRRDHRARHARRDRVRAGIARARRAAQGLARRR